jgi:small basic protein
MLIANAIGIYIGVLADKKIPEEIVKWTAALMFIAFGYIGLYTSVPKEYITFPYIVGLIGTTVLSIWITLKSNRHFVNYES